MKSHSSQSQRRGFATTFALFMLVLVSGALLAVTNLMTTDARRSSREPIDAQLRELLRAGAVHAASHAGDDERVIELRAVLLPIPDSLRRNGGALHLELQPRGEGGGIDVLVRASSADQHAEQIINLRRDGDNWVIHSAQLRP